MGLWLSRSACSSPLDCLFLWLLTAQAHGVVSTNLLRFDVVLGTDMQQSLDATIELAQCLPGFYR